MKFFYLLSLFVFSMFILGCATTGESGTEEAATDELTEDGSGAVRAKTAYEGSTGAGLLMERYKAGQIEGFRE